MFNIKHNCCRTKESLLGVLLGEVVVLLINRRRYVKTYFVVWNVQLVSKKLRVVSTRARLVKSFSNAATGTGLRISLPGKHMIPIDTSFITYLLHFTLSLFS